jgi:hypothetical protein
MKYIKLFEDLFEDELQDFCDTYLAYLKDKGFDIYINSTGWVNGEITISHPNENGFIIDDFSWDEVKDHFIPFIQMLYKEYNYKSDILFYTSNARYITKSFDEVISDKILSRNLKKIIIKKPSEN